MASGRAFRLVDEDLPSTAPERTCFYEKSRCRSAPCPAHCDGGDKLSNLRRNAAVPERLTLIHTQVVRVMGEGRRQVPRRRMFLLDGLFAVDYKLGDLVAFVARRHYSVLAGCRGGGRPSASP